MSDAPGTEMPFLDHLEELRKRLFWIAGAIVIGVVIAFVLLSRLDIIRLLERPILPFLHGQKLIYTHPGTSFHILLNASLALGFVLASPVIIGQAWGFLAPALYAHEKRVVIPVLIAMVALFLAGVSLSFFVVLPLTLQFLISISSSSGPHASQPTSPHQISASASQASPILAVAVRARTRRAGRNP